MANYKISTDDDIGPKSRCFEASGVLSTVLSSDLETTLGH
jgi:hypothetical protein